MLAGNAGASVGVPRGWVRLGSWCVVLSSRRDAVGSDWYGRSIPPADRIHFTFPGRVAAVVLATAWLLAYGPTITGGFIKDDFAWVYHGRLHGWSSVSPASPESRGFLSPTRPTHIQRDRGVVWDQPDSVRADKSPAGLACAASLFALARALGLAAWAALPPPPCGIQLSRHQRALLWFSGRTSLLGTLFSTLAALALTRNRATAAGVLALMAFLSKEEVVALPLILTLWLLLSGSSLKRSLGPWIALAIYFALREYAGAVGISNAPPSIGSISTPPTWRRTSWNTPTVP